MDIGAFLPLLLLVCSAYSAETDQKSNTSGIPIEDESDIHAVLRELTASVAEQKVKVAYLQKENQVQQSKLTELQSQKTELNSLKRQLQAQASALKRLENHSTEVDKLKKQQQDAQVAFSASLVDSGHVTFGPYSVPTPLIYRHVFTNVGNAYSPSTGFFTAPVKGAYHFEFYIGAHGHASHPTGVQLLRNGQHVLIAFSHQPSHYAAAANGVTLLLEVKDVVLLRLWANNKLFDNTNHHSTFSGHLLFAM